MYKELISLNVQMEGMLRVLDARGDDEARRQLAECFALYCRAMQAAGIVPSDDQPAEPSVDEPVEQPDEQPAEQPDEQPAEQPAEQPDEQPAEQPEAEPDADEDMASHSIRVDEMLSRRESLDLRKAFTLNDKFRFRRELFAGEAVAFDDAIDMLMAMHSLDEATDYLLHDMGFDPDDPAVADFMTIVTNHFNAL